MASSFLLRCDAVDDEAFGHQQVPCDKTVLIEANRVEDARDQARMGGWEDRKTTVGQSAGRFDLCPVHAAMRKVACRIGTTIKQSRPRRIERSS